MKNIFRFAIGGSAVFLSVAFLLIRWPDMVVVIASLYFVLICFIDTCRSKIPNWTNASLALAGLIFGIVTGGLSGFLLSLYGLLLGIALLLIPWLMGGFGAGDVKALASLGALIGPKPLLDVFIYMAFFGGAMAVLHYLLSHNLKDKAVEWSRALKATVLTRDPAMIKPERTQTLRFPYAAAIAFGYYTYLTYGGITDFF